ncbi:MAG: DNA recombination protein RecN [Campylobacter sp.]|nr:DNA recombination protein RecN [Campylobacter sp.]
MIERIYIKNLIGFKESELVFSSGLNVFTGISGAGKSVLMSAILAVFGLCESEANVVEADVRHKFDLDEFGIENEEPNNFRVLKEKSARYFVNSQMISKKNLNLAVGSYIKFLGAKNADELGSENLLNLLDILVCKNEPEFREFLSNFRAKFTEFSRVLKELKKIEEEESKIEELKEFAKFEIDKISSISPKLGEYDELIEIKKKLSKKDKIIELWDRAERVFELEKSVSEALNLSGFDSGFFEDCMNELRVKKESLNLDELDEIDIEQILDRIEALSGLNRRYGSIEEALKILQIRKNELEHYEKISFEKRDLQSKFANLQDEILKSSNFISKKRKSVANLLENSINSYLSQLYMNNVILNFKEKNIDENGSDEVFVSINETEFKNLSSGEINRLRLAFIAANLDISGCGSGVLILDEIDSNLSGKEAMSIAIVLQKISKFYQIFAISHQPQLSSKAHTHFLVSKSEGISSVTNLRKDEKINELARMISGEVITKEALEFAKKLVC